MKEVFDFWIYKNWDPFFLGEREDLAHQGFGEHTFIVIGKEDPMEGNGGRSHLHRLRQV